MDDCVIRLATTEDLPEIMGIIADAQQFLRENGVDQWQDGYPNAEKFSQDIERGECWIFSHGTETDGVITIQMSPEPEYDAMPDGFWLYGEPYFVVHRSAVSEANRGRGLAAKMFEYACKLGRERGMVATRLDTHPDNKVMDRFMRRNGFEYRGIVPMDYSTGVKDWAVYEKLL